MVYMCIFCRMRLPAEIVVEKAKLWSYLLVRRPWDDKSKYLASAGFTIENPEALEAAIRDLASTSESHEDGINEYGVFWRTAGLLKGPLRTLPVVLIWVQWTVDGTVRFVTLKPQRVRE